HAVALDRAHDLAVLVGVGDLGPGDELHLGRAGREQHQEQGEKSSHVGSSSGQTRGDPAEFQGDVTPARRRSPKRWCVPCHFRPSLYAPLQKEGEVMIEAATAEKPRAHPRYEVEAYVDVSAPASDVLLFHRIQNISMGGICIQTPVVEEVG